MPCNLKLSHRFGFCLALGLLILAASLPSNAALIAYYNANGNANDQVGGLDGTLENGATYGAGKFGQAFSLDGVNDFVSVPDSSEWTFSGDFTISLWVNFDVVKSGSFPNRLMAHDEGPGEQEKWIYSYDESGTLDFHINSPSISGVTATSPGTFSATPGEWNYFTVTRSGSTYTFYQNGISMGSTTLATAIPNAVANLTFGQGEGNGFVDGRLDEISIYDNALTQSEIQAAMLVPEPGSAGLLACGAAMLLIRRRR